MQERRKYPRISVDLPMTVRLSHHHIVTVKMIELSEDSVKFLCPEAPGINAEEELRFSLPSHRIGHEFWLMSGIYMKRMPRPAQHRITAMWWGWSS